MNSKIGLMEKRFLQKEVFLVGERLRDKGFKTAHKRNGNFWLGLGRREGV